MPKIELLDCTLRDGAYIVDGKFGTHTIGGIIKRLQEANVNIIECGWLKDADHVEGTTYYHTPNDLNRYLISEKNRYTTYVAMIDYNRYNIHNLPDCDGESIDAIRVVFPHGKASEGVSIVKEIMARGYKAYIQAANTLAYSDYDLFHKVIFSINRFVMYLRLGINQEEYQKMLSHSSIMKEINGKIEPEKFKSVIFDNLKLYVFNVKNNDIKAFYISSSLIMFHKFFGKTT